MTLLQLKYAIAIDEAHSMRKASHNLYISQPRLSVVIKELEEEIGITIFERVHSGVVTTPEGKTFIAYARNVIQEYSQLEERYSQTSTTKTTFSVSMQHYMFAVDAYISLLEEYNQEDYYFTIKETKTNEVIEDVKNFKSEVGVIALNDFNSNMLKGILKECNLEFHELFRSSTHVYLSKSHPLADRDELSLDELQDYPCLVFDQGDKVSFYYKEEMLATYDYKKVIASNDRATSADIMKGCNGYAVGVGSIGGIIFDGFVSIKLKEHEELTLGYILRKGHNLSDIGKNYVRKLEEFIPSDLTL
jgi:DNA-binding transcriptional LysR family regulator